MSDVIKVFAVDDEMVNLKLLQKILMDGYELKTCSSSVDAFEAAREFNPDIILLDVFMPEKDGFAVLGEIKSDDLLNDKPIAFACADDSVDLITRAFECGADDYFIKPFKPPLLRRHVDNLYKLGTLKKNA